MRIIVCNKTSLMIATIIVVAIVLNARVMIANAFIVIATATGSIVTVVILITIRQETGSRIVSSVVAVGGRVPIICGGG